MRKFVAVVCVLCFCALMFAPAYGAADVEQKVTAQKAPAAPVQKKAAPVQKKVVQKAAPVQKVTQKPTQKKAVQKPTQKPTQKKVKKNVQKPTQKCRRGLFGRKCG